MNHHLLDKHNFVLTLAEGIVRGSPPELTSDQKQRIIGWCFSALSNNLSPSVPVHAEFRDIYLSVIAFYSPFFREGFNRIGERSIKATIAEKRREGLICPSCDQHIKEYKKCLSSNASRFLISLVSLSEQDRSKGGEGWIHHKQCIYTSRDYPNTAYFGLAETLRSVSGEKRTSGYWRPTSLGVRFVKKQAKIPKYVQIFNGKVTAIIPDEQVSIVDCLGEEFNYQELMRL